MPKLINNTSFEQEKVVNRIGINIFLLHTFENLLGKGIVVRLESAIQIGVVSD